MFTVIRSIYRKDKFSLISKPPDSAACVQVKVKRSCKPTVGHVNNFELLDNQFCPYFEEPDFWLTDSLQESCNGPPQKQDQLRMNVAPVIILGLLYSSFQIINHI